MLPFNTASRRVACGQTPVTLVSSLRSSARDARTSGHVCANACTFQFRSRCMNYPIDPYVSARYTLCVRNLRIQAHPGVSDVSVRTPTSVRPSLCGSSLSSGSSLHRRTYGTRTNRKDHYEILGVERSASISEIKQAYYTLAKKHHPDRQKKQKGNQEAFNLISEAYQILSNEKLRQSYDEGNGPAPNDLSFDAEQMLREFEKAFNKVRL